MNRQFLGLTLATASLLTARHADAQLVHAGPSFTYQCQLKSAGLPANGTFDMQFRLFDAATAGSQVGPTVCADNVQAVDGLVTTPVDFGPVFDGRSFWLQIGVRADTTAGNCTAGVFTSLSPRQPLTSGPYASGLVLPIGDYIDFRGTGLYVYNHSGGAIRGESDAETEAGLFGIFSASTGTGYGIRGEADSDTGIAVAGAALGGPNCRAVWGSSSQGWAGYFNGKGYFSDRVGIGTANPIAPLCVQGGGDLTLTDGGELILGVFTGANLVMDGNEVQARNASAASSLYINANGGNVGIGENSAHNFQLWVNGPAAKPGGGSWSSTSDARLKKNIQPLSGALGTLLRLQGVTFEYIDPHAIGELPGRRTGMIAQEVEEVLPDWVDEGANGFKRITYRGFEALTVEALRDLKHQNEAALAEACARKDAEIAQLHARLDALETAVSRLTAQQAPK
jgi:hypothetical protein